MDLFVLYRRLLAVVCMIYAILQTIRSLWQWLGYFKQSHRTTVLGHYARLLLWRVRWRRFGWDICQIVALLVLFLLLVYGHRFIGGST